MTQAEFLKTLKTGTVLDRTEVQERMLELEIAIVEEHELTLPPASFPWDEFDRRDKVWERNRALLRGGRAGTSVGRAVHAVLQSIDLATGDGIADRARAQAVAEGVPGHEDEIARLARVAVESDIVKRAVASGCLWREVPVAVSTGGGSLHGFIDLLFEEDDGLVVVDYKTDSVGASEMPEVVLRYRRQGGAYPHALQQVTGRQVKEVVFLYLHPRREERLDGLAQAMQDAKEEAEALLDVAGE